MLISSSNILINGAYLSSSLAQTAYQTFAIEPQYWIGPNHSVLFEKDVDYEILFDIGANKSGSFEGKLEVYLTGPVTQPYVESTLGQLLATYTIPEANNTRLFNRQTILFTPKQTAMGRLRFVVYCGEWHISNIKIAQANEFGFNPSSTRITVPINNRRNENIQFKVNLYDVNNNVFPIDIESDPILFDGGTTQIRGTNNRIDGTLIVSPSGSGPILGNDDSGSYIGIGEDELPRPIYIDNLPSYSGNPIITIYSGSTPYVSSSIGPSTGIQIAGGGTSGSFFDFNSYTGRLTLRGDILLLPGTSLSQSIANGFGSGSAGLALEQIQQIVSGTFPSGTFLNGDRIISPVIIGNSGYFASQFGVGDIAGGQGIVLTALGYTASNGTPVAGAPAIYIGAGQFFNANTPFFVASGSNGPLFSLGNLLSFERVAGTLRMTVSGTIGVEASGANNGYFNVLDVIGQIATQSLVTSDANLAFSSSLLTSNITSVSASAAQNAASIINVSQSLVAQDVSYSASLAASIAGVSSSIISVSASAAQNAASIINVSQSLVAQDISYSSSLATSIALLSASYGAFSASSGQDTGSIINLSQSLVAQDIAYSASLATSIALLSASYGAFSASSGQDTGSIINLSQSLVAQDIAYSASLAAAISTNTANITSTSASSAQNAASIINVSQSLVAQDVSYSASLAASIATVSSSLIAVSASIEQASSSQSILDTVNKVIRLPSVTKTEKGLYIESSSIGFWQPHPSGSGSGSANFPVIINESGDFRFANSGSWSGSANNGAFTEQLAFVSGILAIQASKALFATPGLQFSGTPSSIPTTNYIKIGKNASAISAVSGTGFYADGGGNFRVGNTLGSGSDSITFIPGAGLFVSGTSFFLDVGLNHVSGSRKLKISNYEIALGSPIPTSYAPNQATQSVNLVNLNAEQPASIGWSSSPTFVTRSDGTAPQGTHVFEVASPSQQIFHDQIFEIDISQKYKYEFFAKTNSGSNATMYAAIRCYDKDFREITPQTYYAPVLITGSVASTLSSGSTSVTLDNASGFLDDGLSYVAFFAQNDFSDIPNFKIYLISSGSKSGNTFSISSPLLETIPIGTPVRQHLSSGTFIYPTGSVSLPLTYTHYSREIGGMINYPSSDTLGIYPDIVAWRPGTKYAQLGFLTNWTNGAGTSSRFDDIKFYKTSTNAVGFYTNAAGQFFVGSGSVGATAGEGTGSWISFGGTDLNIRTEKLFLNTQGLSILGSNNIASSNAIKLGTNARNLTLASGSGVYIDGDGNFRVGTGTGASVPSYIQFTTGNALIISSSNFFLNSNSASSSLVINPFEIGLGNPRPTAYNSSGNGFYANSAGQFFVGSGSVGATAGEGTGSWISFGGTDLNIRTEKLFLNTPGLSVLGADSAASNNAIKLGTNARNLTLTSGSGVYMDGSGNFRVGTGINATIPSYMLFSPGNALIISASNFFLNSTSSSSSLVVNPFEISMGNPRPTTFNGTGNGFYANSAGQFFMGSGSVGATAGEGTGSWISFGGTDLNIRTEKLFLNTQGLSILGANSVASNNAIKLGTNARNLTLTSGSGVYFDGSGNFRVGTGTSDSSASYMLFSPGNAVIISSSNFFLNSNSGGNAIRVSPFEISLGNPRPASFTGSGNGFYANSAGQTFIGNGSATAIAGEGTGSWISFGGTDLNIRTEKLFLNTPGLRILGSNTEPVASTIKIGENPGNMTLTSGSGFYADGAGNFRVGTSITGSDVISLVPGVGLFISASRVSFDVTNNKITGAEKLKFNTSEFALGKPIPTSFAPPTSVGSNLVRNPDADSAVTVGWNDATSKTWKVVTDGGAPQGSTVFEVTGSRIIFHDDLIPVDITRNYIYKAYAKSNTVPSGVLTYYSVACFDQEFREIFSEHYYAPGNFTASLVTTHQSGSVSITLDDASNFPDSASSFIAFDIKADGSDTPNFTVRRIVPSSKSGNTFTITAPITRTFTSGTLVRYHSSSGTYQYPVSAKPLTTNYVEYSGSVSGIAVFPEVTGSNHPKTPWRPGTKYAKIGFLTNYNDVTETTSSRYDAIQFYDETVGASGFYVNTAGQMFVGSGSVGSHAGEGSGSWISFGGTDLNIRTEKLFLNTPGLSILGSNNVAASNAIKLGTNAKDITLTSGSGVYFDGDGNFRFGTGANAATSSFIQFTPGNALIISASNFFLNSNSGSNSLLISPFEIGLGNPRPTSFEGPGTGFYVNRSGQLFLGSGSAVAGSEIGNWISFGGQLVNIRATAFRLSASSSITLNSNTGGSLALGSATSLTTGTGIYLSGSGDFRAGNPSGARISYINGITTIVGSVFELAAGTLVLSSAGQGSLALGSATGFSTGLGVWMDGSGVFRVGQPVGTAGNKLSFDGTNLVISSSTFNLDTSTVDINSHRAYISLGSAITDFNTGTGIWLSGSGAFRAGNPVGQRVSFDAGALTVSASVLTVKTATMVIDSTVPKIALGSSPDSITLNTGTGIYMNGSGEFKIQSNIARFRFDGNSFDISGSEAGLSISGSARLHSAHANQYISIGMSAADANEQLVAQPYSAAPLSVLGTSIFSNSVVRPALLTSSSLGYMHHSAVISGQDVRWTYGAFDQGINIKNFTGDNNVAPSSSFSTSAPSGTPPRGTIHVRY